MDGRGAYKLSGIRTALDRVNFHLAGGNGDVNLYGTVSGLDTGIPATVTLLQQYPPHPMSVMLQIVDAAGTDLVLACTITGKDIFGRSIKAIMTGLNGTVSGVRHQSPPAFAKVESIVIDSATNGAAGDSVNFGIGNGNATANRANFAIPFQVPATGEVVVQGFMDDTPVAPVVNLSNGTVQLDVSAAAAPGSTVTLVFDHDVAR